MSTTLRSMAHRSTIFPHRAAGAREGVGHVSFSAALGSPSRSEELTCKLIRLRDLDVTSNLIPFMATSVSRMERKYCTLNQPSMTGPCKRSTRQRVRQAGCLHHTIRQIFIFTGAQVEVPSSTNAATFSALRLVVSKALQILPSSLQSIQFSK